MMVSPGQLTSLIETNGWQDVVLAAGNIFFCFTLLPALRHPGRPPLLTCIPTGIALLAGAFVFATLHLWFTALTQTITGLQWLALACKKISSPGATFKEKRLESDCDPDDNISGGGHIAASEHA
jgi:hypothetical protein